MRNSCPVYVSVAGVLILIVAIITGWYALPVLENYLILSNIALKEGNPAYELWKNPPFPFKLRVYIFNVTNPDEFNNGALAIVKEIGPYVYDEYRKKTIIETSEDNDTITYTQTRQYVFNQKESACRSQDDVITVANIGLLSCALRTINLPAIMMAIMNNALPFLYPGLNSVFIRTTVKELLFDGIKLSCEAKEAAMVCDAVSKLSAQSVRRAENGRDFLVAMFHHMNNTLDGPYTMQRGIKSTERGRILAYKDDYTLSQWGDDSCNSINGTDLTLISTQSMLSKKVEFFAQDICRSLHADFSEISIYNELPVYKFEIKEPVGSGSISEKCFCVESRGNNPSLPDCTPSGTMDLFPCVNGPIILSFPHFYLGDPSLLEYVQGLNPQAEDHKTILEVEPKTGTPVVVKSRVQLNVPLVKISGITVMKNVSEGIFPVIWMEQGAEIPTMIFIQLKNNLEHLHSMLDILKWLLIALGILVMLIGIGLTCFREKYLFTKRSARSRMFSSHKLYPALYPQLENKNVNYFSGPKYIDVAHID